MHGANEDTYNESMTIEAEHWEHRDTQTAERREAKKKEQRGHHPSDLIRSSRI